MQVLLAIGMLGVVGQDARDAEKELSREIEDELRGLELEQRWQFINSWTEEEYGPHMEEVRINHFATSDID